MEMEGADDKSAVFSLRQSFREVMSASAGSIACCYAGQPFDTVKVRLQAAPELYSNPLVAAVATARQEGVTALWKGAVPTAMGMIAENAVAFGVRGQLKRMFPGAEDSGFASSIAREFMLGYFTGCCASLVLCPSEVVKALTQLEGSGGKKDALSSWQVTQRIWQTRGLPGFFAGLEAQIMRDGPFYAFFFGSYELFGHLMKTYTPAVPDEARFFLAGGLAGMAGWAAVMPADVPKSIVQTNWNSRVAGDFWPTLSMVYRERGISGLYSGLRPALLRAFPANAALFLTEELVKKAFEGAGI
mmetsp:Transcript_11704/g.43611  ORF Transcript_11704/g.43611 Transcript_11704/m.43611 type:complete len:301 (-) Transcript_11704:1350-2252(-)